VKGEGRDWNRSLERRDSKLRNKRPDFKAYYICFEDILE
jgi:hypothetical protein